AIFFFFSSRRRHTRFSRDWSSDVCSSDLSSTKSSLRKWFLSETKPMSSYAEPISFTNFCFLFGSSDRKSAKSTLGILFIAIEISLQRYQIVKVFPQLNFALIILVAKGFFLLLVLQNYYDETRNHATYFLRL